MQKLLLMLLLTANVSAYANISVVLSSKTCVQFLADSKEGGTANVANGRMVQAYLVPFGFDKTDKRQWYMSILVVKD